MECVDAELVYLDTPVKIRVAVSVAANAQAWAASWSPRPKAQEALNNASSWSC